MENRVGTYTSYGGHDSLLTGVNYYDAETGYACRAIMANTQVSADSITSILSNTSDIMVACSAKFDYKSNRNLLSTDAYYIYALKVDSSGTQIHIDESRCDADTIRAATGTRALWTTNNAGSSGNDYYAMKIDSFTVADTNASGWYVFGGDSANYDGWMRMADSINYGAWKWRGLVLFTKTTHSIGDYLSISSSETASAPVFWYESISLVAQAGEPTSTTNRHNAPNRHGAYRQ